MNKQLSDFLTRASRARVVHALVLTRVLIGALLLSGCVSATAYEQATSAAEVEREGQRRALARLEQSDEKLRRLEAERAALEGQLAAREEQGATSELSVTRVSKERDEQAELVVQLRGELERLGEHLKVFSEQKGALSSEKLELEAELDRVRAEMTRLRAEINALERPAELRAKTDPDAAFDKAPSDADVLGEPEAPAEDATANDADAASDAPEESPES